MSQQPTPVYEFGSFRIDPVKRLLLRNGQPISLKSKSFDTLLALVERHGQVVNKDDLMKTLWPDTVVEENNITQQISVVRKALGERAGEHRYVVTIPGRGYSFVADVREHSNGSTDLIVEEHTRSSITVDFEEEHENGNLISHQRNGGFIPQTNVKYLPLDPTVSGAWKRPILVFLIAAVLIGFGSAMVWWRWPKAVRRNDIKRSVAVLPFKSLNNDPATDYLGSGMSDTLIAKLSNVHQISVRPTSAVIKYSGQVADAQTVGRELGVDSVLEGTVQSAGDRVRVTVQLINAQDGSPLWAQTFSEKITDIFGVQDTISEQVAQTMLVQLNGEEQKQLRKRDTDNLEAYQEYLKGRFFWNKRNEEGLRKGIEHFNVAVSLDQSYSKAYAGLADSYIVIAYYGTTSSVSYESAKAAAIKALELDDTLAEAHTSLAVIKSVYDHDEVGAQTEFTRAIELNPNYATAHHWYSDYLAIRGRQDEALAEIRRAQELDPLSPIINTTLGEQLYYSRRYDEAISQLQRTLEIAPDFGPAHYTLALVLEQKGLFAQAIAEFQKAQAVGGTTLGISAALAHTYALAGQKVEARRILNELLGQQTRSAPYDLAMIYQGLGEKQQAIDWLRKLKDKKGDLALLLRSDPRLDDLRSDSRFKELLQKDFKNASSRVPPHTSSPPDRQPAAILNTKESLASQKRISLSVSKIFMRGYLPKNCIRFPSPSRTEKERSGTSLASIKSFAMVTLRLFSSRYRSSTSVTTIQP